jgi:hypothetical protein
MKLNIQSISLKALLGQTHGETRNIISWCQYLFPLIAYPASKITVIVKAVQFPNLLETKPDGLVGVESIGVC